MGIARPVLWHQSLILFSLGEYLRGIVQRVQRVWLFVGEISQENKSTVIFIPVNEIRQVLVRELPSGDWRNLLLIEFFNSGIKISVNQKRLRGPLPTIPWARNLSFVNLTHVFFFGYIIDLILKLRLLLQVISLPHETPVHKFRVIVPRTLKISHVYFEDIVTDLVEFKLFWTFRERLYLNSKIFAFFLADIKYF